MNELAVAATPFASRLYSVAQIRAMEHELVAADTGLAVMRRAAQAALDGLRKYWPQARNIAVWCGPGNNGGDGYLLSALARQAGLQVRVYALTGQLSGDALLARQACIDAGITPSAVPQDELPAEIDVHVDALYGIGLNRAPAPEVVDLFERIQRHGRPVLALDVPSGLDADTGQVIGDALRASVTVTFLANKRGLWTGMAADYAGVIEVADVGWRREVQPDAWILQADYDLPPRSRTSHKGRNGHVLAIGGDHGTAGAIRLSSEAALRVGAGLVSVATRKENVGVLNTARPELMAHAIDGPQALQPLIHRATVLAVGPGLGQQAWGHALWLTALDASKTLVLDADGLNLLAREARVFTQPVVLTPHPGEAARLLATDAAGVENDRFAAVRAIASRYNAVVVLKGAGSLIANPQSQVAVCAWGNPGMASGGMGDLLTGVIAALLAQGCDAWQAACLGVGLHARAGDLVARQGERGLLASDLLEPLRRLVNGGAHA